MYSLNKTEMEVIIIEKKTFEKIVSDALALDCARGAYSADDCPVQHSNRSAGTKGGADAVHRGEGVEEGGGTQRA